MASSCGAGALGLVRIDSEAAAASGEGKTARAAILVLPGVGSVA
jgi:hypothetical protein